MDGGWGYEDHAPSAYSSTRVISAGNLVVWTLNSVACETRAKPEVRRL